LIVIFCHELSESGLLVLFSVGS